MSQLCQPIPQDEYNQFNLQNINTPTPPKWKNNEYILEDFKKFKRSCMCNFDGPMTHITNGKVTTNMFLLWAGPNSEDIYENPQLSSSQQYNLDAVFEAFERYCEPICNFCVARLKFRVVKQHETETINTFYHSILRLARQCQFENINEHLIYAIVYGCKSKKVQDKLLQMPITMALEECLLICRHYESLQWDINTVRPTGEFKGMDGLARRCPRPRSRSNTRRPQHSTVHPEKPRSKCNACGTLHQVGECPAASVVCFKCNKQGHFSRLCQSQSTTTSTPNSSRNIRGSWCSRGRGNRSRGHGSKCVVYEGETSDTSKPIVDATNSEVDVVKLLQAYGMVPTEGSKLKHRRKKVATDEISIANPDSW